MGKGSVFAFTLKGNIDTSGMVCVASGCLDASIGSNAFNAAFTCSMNTGNPSLDMSKVAYQHNTFYLNPLISPHSNQCISFV